MPEYRRWHVPGATFFFTVVTHQRRPFLIDPTARLCLRQAMQSVRARWPFDITAMVLLPDHLHAIWTLPPGDAAYPVRWQRIKTEFTARHLQSGGAEGEPTPSRARRNDRGLWQRRF